MRLSIKTKQVAGVTTTVGLVVLVMSGLHLSSLARVRLQESQARADLLANAIFQRAREVVAAGGDPAEALRADGGLRSILESSAYSTNVTYAAITDADGVAIVHSDAAQAGRPLPDTGQLDALLERGALAQLAIYAGDGRTLEVPRPLLLGDVRFGSIRIGVSSLLVRQELDEALRPALATAIAAIGGASLLAMVLAQLLLRPIHVIRSGLTRLGRGEFGVVLDLPQRDEFGDLGADFNAVSAQLSAARREPPPRPLGQIEERLDDALAVVAPDGTLLFANEAMEAVLPPHARGRAIGDLWASGHPYRATIERTLESGQAMRAVPVRVPDALPDPADEGTPQDRERLVLTHIVAGDAGRPIAIMLVARDLGYLNRVRSTISSSQKLAALSRLSAGVAHEMKNPLNAIVIHLELLKQQLGASEEPLAREHLTVITAQIQRLDEVVQGFLKFIRPQELKSQAVLLADLVGELRPVITAEAEKSGVSVETAFPDALPRISADPGLLQQAVLNLALNACQAMPEGGRLRLAGSPTDDGRVALACEDTGVGIAPEDLGRIFDLYFTTKTEGSGIGLSLVYRIVQLHGGEIEVESTPGQGTTFRLILPIA